MRRYSTFSNYNPEKAGGIALLAFAASLIFKGRKKNGKRENIFIRFVRNFTRVSAAVGIASVFGAKNAVNNKDDGISFEQAAEMYNKSTGETVINVEYDEKGNAKGTVKCTKTYSDLDNMTSQP